MTYPYGYCLTGNDDADGDARGFLSDTGDKLNSGDEANTRLLPGLLLDDGE